MNKIEIKVASIRLIAQFEDQHAPQTCAAFRKVMPFTSQLVQARWSGESAWIPLGDFQFGVSYENHTSYPSAGNILLYPGGISETEILFPYGSTAFASKMGQLAGNHFLTIIEGREHLAEIGRLVLWEGAQPIVFSELK
jgi:hypothetical protein